MKLEKLNEEMPQNDECSSEENVVRAICPPHYDPDTDKITSTLFRGGNISVSRLMIKPLDELIEIFKKEVVKEEKPLTLVGEINVGTLKYIGNKYGKDQKGRDKPKEISVIPKPTDTNSAHAEIPQKLSRGIANKIIEQLKRHPV